MNTAVLYAVSFTTNAAILIFEIAGGRLLAPYLGTSVGVWAGTISIVLAGMALGYHWGGKIADKNSSPTLLGRLLFAAGLSALIAWSVRDIVPTMFAVIGLPETWGALLIGAVLFMPTVFILAGVSPLLVRNLVKTVEQSGSATGTLNAVGTAGSIFGAVLTGAFLLSYFGVSYILLGVAVLLLFTGFLFLRKSPVVHALILIAVIVLAFFLNAFPTRASTAEADISTAYNRIFLDRVAFFDNARSLSMDPFGIQCAMHINEDQSADEHTVIFPYVKAFEIIRERLYPDGNERTLFLGGCNYSYPRFLLHQHPKMVADVVEIDPGMTEIAEKYFSLDLSKFPTLSIFHTDARMFLKESREPYELVFMDTFGSSKGIPVHLTTKEMFESIAKQMREDSYLVINAHGGYAGEHARFSSALFKTVRSVFPEVSVFAMNEDPELNQNLIFVASFKDQLPDILFSREYLDVALIKVRLPESDITLTDDFAPVERLMP